MGKNVGKGKVGIKKKKKKSSKDVLKGVKRTYFDACSLEAGRDAYSDIVNTRDRIGVISHLALGEAYGNCYKQSKSKEAKDSFIKLIDDLVAAGQVEIVGHDDVENYLDEIKSKCGRLSWTDLTHFATAISKKCDTIQTTDPDLCGIPKSKLNMLRAAFGLDELIIKCSVSGSNKRGKKK